MEHDYDLGQMTFNTNLYLIHQSFINSSEKQFYGSLVDIIESRVASRIVLRNLLGMTSKVPVNSQFYRLLTKISSLTPSHLNF